MYSYIIDATDINEVILLLEIRIVFETLGKEYWEGVHSLLWGNYFQVNIFNLL